MRHTRTTLIILGLILGIVIVLPRIYPKKATANTPQIRLPAQFPIENKIYLPVVPRNVQSALNHDGISNSESGWHEGSSIDGKSKWSYENGKYTGWLGEAHAWAAVTAPISGFDTYSLQVTATRSGGAYSVYGVIFGWTDWEHFTLLKINSALSQYGIFRYKSGTFETIIDWTSSPYINSDSTPNLLQVDCMGDSIQVFTNGHPLSQVTGTQAVDTQMGLYIESNADVPLTVYFDDVTVKP